MIDITGTLRDAAPSPGCEDRPEHTINTSRLTEEDLRYEDEEPDIAFIVPAHRYRAVFENGASRPVVLWAITDAGAIYGVALPEDGRPPLELENIEDEQGFSKYEYQKEDA